MERRLWMLLIGLTILLSGGPVWAQGSLEQRLNSWPDWSLPAPLPRPSNRDDLIYPDWFAGLWQVESVDLDAPDEPPLLHQARFQADRRGRLIGDRSFNATAIGRALLGDQLLRVEDDPDSANRQMAQLKGDLRLETSVTGRRQETLGNDGFLADELVLQILHAPGPPRLSRIETLSLYKRCEEAICADQWQARYAPPGQTLR
ncbi:MAG: POLO box duplicated region, partial [Cyanobacteriota bacterium]|nr:POLO box duplicated region [Cyanobacteriota bacterium]